MRMKRGYIQRRGNSFRISYYSTDHVRQFETFRTEEEAHRELAKRLAEVHAGIPVSSKPNTVRFGELCDDVVTDYEVRRLKSRDDMEIRFRLHIVPVFGDRKAINITSANLKSYVQMRREEKASEGTIARELEAIRRAFKLAIREGKFLARCPAIPKLADKRREGFFTREEVDRVCSHLPAPLDSFVLFGFLTGWRIGEIRNLRWSNVDFVACEIRLDPGTTKNGEGRVFPMIDELRELLDRLKAGTRTAPHAADTKIGKHAMLSDKVTAMVTNVAHVFSINGKPIGEFRKSWKTACYRAGLPCIVAPVKKGGIPGTVRVLKSMRIFHDLRRSAARARQQEGFSEGQIMRLMGWKTRSVFDRYQIVTDADLREKFRSIQSKHKTS